MAAALKFVAMTLLSEISASLSTNKSPTGPSSLMIFPRGLGSVICQRLILAYTIVDLELTSSMKRKNALKFTENR